MNRREALASLSALAGHALFPDVVAAFARAIAQPAGSWRPTTMTQAQGALLVEAVDTILPATGTPGAKDARVHEFVDLVLARCVDERQRSAVVRALDALGADFAAAPAAERERRLTAMDAAPFALLRELTLLGYFSSEIGCTRALAYVAVPGEYKGCIPLAPGQKAWATR